MNYKSISSKVKKINLSLSILVLMIAVLMALILPSIVRASAESVGDKRNMFYIQVLNYTMPLVKTTTFDEEDMLEAGNTVQSNVLGFLGLDLKSPFSIIGKELACISGETPISDKNSVNTNFSFNPFKLNDNAISRDKVPESTDTTGNEPKPEDLNLPDKNVNVYDPNLKKTINVAKPEVFIYHTHTSEGYGVNNPDSNDETKNVVSVGNALKVELESKYGISVVQDKTIHDANTYNKAYERSGATVDQYLKKYGDFKLIIDLHRDSIEDRKTETIKLNGENTAKFMFVMATQNPHYSKNIALVNKMLSVSNKLFPGLAKSTFSYKVGTKYFNQAKSNNAVLLEVGSHVNTPEEAQNTAKYLARIIAESINGKN